MADIAELIFLINGALQAKQKIDNITLSLNKAGKASDDAFRGVKDSTSSVNKSFDSMSPHIGNSILDFLALKEVIEKCATSIFKFTRQNYRFDDFLHGINSKIGADSFVFKFNQYANFQEKLEFFFKKIIPDYYQKIGLLTLRLNNAFKIKGLVFLTQTINNFKNLISGSSIGQVLGKLALIGLSAKVLYNFTLKTVKEYRNFLIILRNFLVIFGKVNNIAKESLNTLINKFDLTEKSAKALMNAIGGRLLNFDFDLKLLTKMSGLLAKLTKLMAIFFGVSLLQIVKKLTGALAGETGGLRLLGIIINRTSIRLQAQQMALLSGVTEETARAQLIYNLILRSGSIYSGSFAAQSNTLQNSLNNLKNTLNSGLLVSLGNVLDSIFTPFVNMLLHIVNLLSGLFGPMLNVFALISRFLSEHLMISLKILPIIKETINSISNLGKITGSVFSMITNSLEFIIAALTKAYGFYLGDTFIDGLKAINSVLLKTVSLLLKGSSYIKKYVDEVRWAIGINQGYDTLKAVEYRKKLLEDVKAAKLISLLLIGTKNFKTSKEKLEDVFSTMTLLAEAIRKKQAQQLVLRKTLERAFSDLNIHILDQTQINDETRKRFADQIKAYLKGENLLNSMASRFSRLRDTLTQLMLEVNRELEEINRKRLEMHKLLIKNIWNRLNDYLQFSRDMIKVGEAVGNNTYGKLLDLMRNLQLAIQVNMDLMNSLLQIEALMKIKNLQMLKFLILMQQIEKLKQAILAANQFIIQQMNTISKFQARGVEAIKVDSAEGYRYSTSSILQGFGANILAQSNSEKVLLQKQNDIATETQRIINNIYNAVSDIRKSGAPAPFVI